MTAGQEMIRRQLVLRAIVWDVQDVEKEEIKRLEEEIQLFEICKVRVERGRKKEVPPLDKPEILYRIIQKDLKNAGVLEETALLVTDDPGLAKYVYSFRNGQCIQNRSSEKQNPKPGYCLEKGMGVVFYERSGCRTDAAADMIVLGFEEIGIQFFDRVQKRRNHLPWNILYTERACVREITIQDLDELYALYEGDGITDYTEPLMERKLEEDYTRSYIDSMYYYYGYGMWIVRDRKTGELIGRAGIEHRETEDGVVMELGYIIGTAYQGQGYATEVCGAIAAYAKEELGMEELHCFIHPRNQRSIHVAEKLGFIRVLGEGQGGLLHFQAEL